MPEAPITEQAWEDRKKAAQARSTALAAETTALEAELANIRARETLTAAKAPPDPAKVAQAQRLAQARQEKEQAKAGSDEAQAKIASWKAAVDAMPASPIGGNVVLGEKAGHMETALLATRALASGAERIAAAVAQLSVPPAAILVVPHGETPDFKALNAFRTFVALLTPELALAQRSLEGALSRREMAAMGAVAGVGLALEAASKLLAYFRTDYTIGGSESTADHLALAELVAGRLRRTLPGTRIYLQSLYAGQAPALSTDFIDKELGALSELHRNALAMLADVPAPAQVPAVDAGPPPAAPDPAAATPPAAAPAPVREALDVGRNARVASAAERLRMLVALYDTTFDKLVADGMLETLVRQSALEAKLSGGQAHVLVARLHKAGGSHYVTKNLWNLFGKMPFKVMGGAVFSYSLFDAISGELLQSDTYPVHGGFQSANELS